MTLLPADVLKDFAAGCLFCFGSSLTGGALGACRLLGGGGVDLNACKLRIDHDATAIFTHNDLLVHLDLHLALRRDAVEAAATGITLDIYDAETIAGILADTLEGVEGALVDLGFECKCLGAELLLVLLGLAHDLFKFVTLLVKDMIAVDKLGFRSFDLSCLVLYRTGIFIDVLLCKLYLEGLIFNLLGEKIILAVVSHIVYLLAIDLDLLLSFLYMVLLGSRLAAQLFDIGAILLDSGVEAFNLILKVTDFKGELTADKTYAIYL